MTFYSPLRYPGGKGKLMNFIKLVYEQNGLLDGHYAEPYAGGAGIGIGLLIQEYASCIHLNDLNPSVYAFWHSVINYPNELCRKIEDVKVTTKEWYRQKAVQGNPKDNSLLELGFSTFFLNRTNRSGIILGGIIGGKNQTGEWKIDARFNKKDLIRRIEKIALYSSRIRLYNLDASEMIKTVFPELPKKTLVYLDPPYYAKGQELYENHYRHEDHASIAKLIIKKIKLPWIVSYDNERGITKMYKGCPTLRYGINYSAAERYRGSEVMFFSNSLVIPDVKNPANLKIA